MCIEYTIEINTGPQFTRFNYEARVAIFVLVIGVAEIVSLAGLNSKADKIYTAYLMYL